MKNSKENMKKSIAFFALIFVAYIVITALPTAFAEESEYELEMMHYEPFPVSPGQEFEIWFKIRNLAGETIQPVVIQAVDEFPFVVIGDKNITIPSLDPRQYYTFKFKFRVENNAAQGNNELKLKLKYGNDPYIKKSFDVLVSSQSPMVDIKSIETNPQKVVPGKEFEMKVYLANSDKATLRNLKVSLNLDSLPFSPLKSSNYQSFDVLEPSEQVTASFKLIADSDTTPGVYKIPLTLQYEDTLGNTYTSSQVVGILLSDVIDNNIEPIIESAKLYPDKESEIDVKFVNKGLSEVKSLIAEIIESDDYEIVGSNKEYVGSINSDDYDSAEFTIIPKKTGNIDLKIRYQYLNSMNEFFEKDITISLNSADIVAKESSSSTGKIILAIIVIAIIVGIYWKWKKR